MFCSETSVLEMTRDGSKSGHRSEVSVASSFQGYTWLLIPRSFSQIVPKQGLDACLANIAVVPKLMDILRWLERQCSWHTCLGNRTEHLQKLV